MGTIEEFIQQVNDLLRTHPKVAEIQKRHVIPPYNEARHAQIMETLQDYNILNPRPEQALQLHLYDRANEKIPRQRKKK